jgi:tRNA(Arg) A34 adenosine deaminase TadA
MEQKPDHKYFLKMAVEEAFRGMRSGDGGPFGAIVILEGEIIAKAHNTVLLTRDPTAHAEVNAIREACRRLQRPHLKGAVIYSNFEPCPMCLSAIYWAEIQSLYFCNGRSDTEKIGFRDRQIFDELSLGDDLRALKTTRISLREMELLMAEWMQMDGKNLY